MEFSCLCFSAYRFVASFEQFFPFFFWENPLPEFPRVFVGLFQN